MDKVSLTVTDCILETSLHINCSQSGKGIGQPANILAKAFYLEGPVFFQKQTAKACYLDKESISFVMQSNKSSQVQSNNQSICMLHRYYIYRSANISGSPDIFWRLFLPGGFSCFFYFVHITSLIA